MYRARKRSTKRGRTKRSQVQIKKQLNRSLMRINYWNLKMGLVEANLINVKRSEVALWEKAGFINVKFYPLFHTYSPEQDEVSMLGVPKKLEQFGAWRMKQAKVLEVSNHKGSYGMGGPGFFALLLETVHKEKLWLNFAVWGANKYVLINDQWSVHHHSCQEGVGSFYTFAQVEELLQGAILKELTLLKHELFMLYQLINGEVLEMRWVQTHKVLTSAKESNHCEKAYVKGAMSDVCLVTYEGTTLVI